MSILAKLVLSRPVIWLYRLFSKRRTTEEVTARMRETLKDYPADRHVHNMYYVCDTLDNLNMEETRKESDALLARMQTPESREAMRKAYNASPEELGKVAVEAARKRKEHHG